MRTRFLLAGVMAVMVASAIGVAAQRPGGPGGPDGQGRPGGPPCGPNPLALTDLTADQRTAIQAILDKTRDTAKPLDDQAKSLLDQLTTALASGSGETAAAGDLREKIATIQTQLRQLNDATRTQVDAILTDAQRAELKALADKGRGMRGGPMGPDGTGMGPRGGRPDGPPPDQNGQNGDPNAAGRMGRPGGPPPCDGRG